jgi:predicted restriction endonuclease
MEMIQCACGCGEWRERFDSRGRERRYMKDHQNREKTKAQKDAARNTLERVRPRIAWNKGKTYIHSSKQVYANKGAWNAALRRLYPDKCMICGWDKATCDTHHITPRALGGAYTIANGIILCPNCHRLAHVGMLSVNDLVEAKSRIAQIGEII